MPVAGLGPAGLGGAADRSYRCGGDTLGYRTSTVDDGSATGEVTLRRIGGATPPVPDTKVSGRTWLSAAELKDRPQDLSGFWRMAGDTENGDALRWAGTPDARTLNFHRAARRDSEVPHIDMIAMDGAGRYAGNVYVCPRGGRCPNLCRWAKGSLAVRADRLSIAGEWHDRQSKSDCSGFGDEPDSATFRLERFVGAAFVPIVAGKYIVVAGAPAVGDAKAQFKAAARIKADYFAVPKARLRTAADRGTLAAKDPASGLYEFAADRAGRYELRFELIDEAGRSIHVDRLRIDVPALPGIAR